MLLSITAAALRLGVSRRTIEREIADGALPVVEIRGARRIDADDLNDYLSKSTTQQKTPAKTGSGVYLLLMQGAVVYVGKSKNMQRRIGQHAAASLIKFDAYQTIDCSPTALDTLERQLIEKHMPQHNRHYKPCS